jgi:hypothetical protein
LEEIAGGIPAAQEPFTVAIAVARVFAGRVLVNRPR